MALLSRVGKCVLPFKVNDVIFISLCGTICVSFLYFLCFLFIFKFNSYVDTRCQLSTNSEQQAAGERQSL